MMNYANIRTISLGPQAIHDHIIDADISEETIKTQLKESIIRVIESKGFQDYDPQCLPILQRCSIDFSYDLILRFKQYLECIGSKLTFQDVLQKTLIDVMTINLQQLTRFMLEK